MMNNSLDGGTPNEWELSKENVQPLKQGRKFSSLNAALQPHTGDQQAKLKEQRQIFESDLRTYNGDDPLDVWYRYVKWTEQNFPKGGKDGNLQSILQRCVAMYKDDPRYTNDHRYIECWVKFAGLCNEPLEIYNFLYNQGIGCGVAMFFIGWAAEFEQAGNTKKADAVFKDGIQRCAQPTERLLQLHSEFQARVARKATGEVMETEEQEEDMEEQRTTLGALRPVGRRGAVGTTRTGGAKAGSQGGLKLKMPTVQSQIGPSFEVYNDENASSGSSLPPQTGEYVTAPTRPEVYRKENEQKAGVWTSAKVKQKNTPVVPVSEVTQYKRPAFEVHVDENADQPMMTPRKMPEIGNQVLSARKPAKPTDPLQTINQFHQEEPGKKPMYCKDKIYCGTEEFSFEELRAARWRARMRKQKEKEMEERRRMLEKQEEEFLRQREEKLRLEQQLFEQQRKEMEERHQLLMQQHQEKLERERTRQQQLMEQELQKKFQDQLQVNQHAPVAAATGGAPFMDHKLKGLRDTGLSGQPPFGENLFNGNTSMKDQLVNNSLNSTRTPNFNMSSNASTSSSNTKQRSVGPSPDSGAFNPFRGSAKNTPLKGPMTAPSPTVNTREAMQVVMGMFNNTLDIEKNLGWNADPKEDDEDDFCMDDGEEFGAQFSATSTKKVSAFVPVDAPFTIFDDEAHSKENKKGLSPQMPEDEAKENRPPFGLQDAPKRQGLSGVLQPATDILCIPLEEQKKMMGEEEQLEEEVQDQMDVMQGSEVNNYDMTFAPQGGGPSNFAAAARLASTPFNPLGDHPSFNAPPLSTIRPSAMDSERTDFSETSKHYSVFEDENHENRNACGLPARTENMATGKSPEGIFQINSESSKTGLSPIMERSDEEVKSSRSHSQGSSVASSQHSMHELLNNDHHSRHPPPPCDHPRHQIDMSTYIAPEDLDEKTINILSTSIAIDPYDPFDESLVARFLGKLSIPVSSYSNYHAVQEEMPEIKAGTAVSLDNDLYSVNDLLGEGGFAKVYRVSLLDSTDIGDLDGGDQKYVMKVQKPPCPWEFYICTELHKRLSAQAGPDMRPTMMSVEDGYFFHDGSILINKMYTNGTLLNLANTYKAKHMSMCESLAMYLTIQLLHIVEKMHQCRIIHGDIKPDNFLLLDFPHLPHSTNTVDMFENAPPCMKLIDFGRSIDMTMFPAGTTFLAKVNTSGFQCIEMKTDMPWTYQTDLFGIVGTIHVLIFGEYMNVFQANGRWKTTHTVKRWWKQDLWKRFFDKLLNVPSCDDLPNLGEIRKEFEQCFMKIIDGKFSEFDNEVKRISVSHFELNGH